MNENFNTKQYQKNEMFTSKFNKKVQELYTEKYKTYLREIREYLNK